VGWESNGQLGGGTCDYFKYMKSFTILKQWNSYRYRGRAVAGELTSVIIIGMFDQKRLKKFRQKNSSSKDGRAVLQEEMAGSYFL
jgi:hypothetical protein